MLELDPNRKEISFPPKKLGTTKPRLGGSISTAKDASASAGLDLRYDTQEKKPWCVVVWPEGTEKRFETKQDAYDYIKSIDDDEFWDEGKGAARDRDRVR